MNEIEELRRRVGRLEARAEIGELVSAYAIACDEHDMPRLSGLFTRDARFTSPSGVMVADGRDAIAAMFVELFKIRGPAFHWTHDHFVRFDGADDTRAAGTVLSHAETTPDNIVSLAAMRYGDQYRHEGGRWLIAARDISFLYYVPAKDYATALAGPMRLSAGGTRRAADYPETLESWQAFAGAHGERAAE